MSGARPMILAIGLAALVAGSAMSAQPPKPPTPVEPPPPVADPPPPYEPQLLRLAEVMGALAYLRDLCGAGDAGAFRERMASLLDAEAKTQARKEAMAGAYNKGFGDYGLFYRACTPAAREIIVRFLDEAARISADVANRYGG